MADGPRRCRIRHGFLLISAVLVAVIGCLSAFSARADADGSGSCPFSSSSFSSHDHDHHHGGHHHHHHEECGHEHHHHHHERSTDVRQRRMLPEELAEEEDLRMESSLEHDHHDHHHHHSSQDLSTLGLWVTAMGCSLLVSLASLICLILLPVLFLKGTPSKVVVDALATFGAGAMLGDAFLHQLPHAFSGRHSHSHDHHIHDHHEVAHSHSHSLQDLSVGLSVLFGIVLFLLVEKAVRYVEEISGKEAHAWGHGHHHHHHKYHNKLKNDDDTSDALQMTSEEKPENKYKSQKDEKQSEPETLHKRTTVNGSATDAKELDAAKDIITEEKASPSDPSLSSPSSLVFGYLNLFSDGVHNFTDGMALGSAFLLYGSVGGWSRTLFLLAHELPQEIGDFGILVRSGFTVSKALFFNFLSALVALVGTALALLLGKDPGQSSLIEGFTAGGFIYIAVAGVLPELNNGSTTFRSTSIQLGSLITGMGVALCISLAE